MFISDKYALYRFLNSYVSSNGSTLFLRTGSSDDLPAKLQDLAGTSVAAIGMTYRTQTTGSDNMLRRTFGRNRSYQPLGGYGMRRTYTVGSANILTYNVVPETVLSENTTAVWNPVNYAAAAGKYGDYQTHTLVPIAPGKQTLDFGRTLRFRGLTVYSASNLTTLSLEYLAADGTTWTQVQASLVNGDYQFDFTARRVRIINPGTTTAGTGANLMFFAERGTEFAVRPITHGVLVPNLDSSSYSTIQDISKVDYLSLVLDVGADLVLNTNQTGKLTHLSVQDFLLPVKSASRQGA